MNTKSLTFVTLAALAGCGSDHAAPMPDGPTVDAPGQSDASSSTVTFSYTPQWSGVQSVDVLGGFGQSGDWTTPLVTLASSGGTYTGSATLPAGTYDYVFRVIGDADAGTKATTFKRYTIDPSNSTFENCPSQSPTYNANNPNPCSQVTAPQTTSPTVFHVQGTVVLDGSAKASYLVVLEREEPSSHHFFVNRVTTAADGTYDLVAAAGKYRLQVQHPQFESKTDDQLDPKSLNIVRRDISSAFSVAADMTISNAEVAFHDYASFSPVTTGTPLPTTFSFGTSSALPTHLDVYGTPNGGAGSEIGDPWYVAATTLTGSAAFDGTFNQHQATEPSVVTGERYFWGVEQPHPADSAGIVWTDQSLVFPITWH